jgi:nicotinamidase/pyrazinamidase
MRALLAVDLQNDFMPDGNLPVPDAYDVIPVVNALMEKFDFVVATQDWHPPDHGSFASNHEEHEVGEVIEWYGLDQILWPDHCVEGTEGADFVEGFDQEKVDEVVHKATDPRYDSYSAFFDNGHKLATGLDSLLSDRGVDTVYIAGVATDYCVKYSALDARRLDLETYVVIDGCRGIEREEGDIEEAIEQMREAGVKVVTSDEVEAEK